MPNLFEFNSAEVIFKRISNPELGRFFYGYKRFLEDQTESSLSEFFQGLTHVTIAALM